MPKATVLQESFNTGEVSPLYYSRVTSDRYKQSMETCLNYIPTLQGPLVRRPGTKFMNLVKDSANPPILVPFNLSVTQAYILEFGDGYVRFYANNGQVVSPGNYYKVTAFGGIGDGNKFAATKLTLPTYDTGTLVTGPATLELPTLYKVADLAGLRWAQNKNTLYIAHPSYPPMKLEHVSTYEWTVSYVTFIDGPYLPANTINSLADGATITLTPNNAATSFTLFTQKKTISGATNNGAGLIRIAATAHGFTTGQLVYISSVAGTTEANNGNMNTATASWPITVINANSFDLIGSTFVHSYVSGGTAQPAFLPSYIDAGGLRGTLGYERMIGLVASDGKRYSGYLFSSIIGNVANFSVALSSPMVNNAVAALPDTTPIVFWYLGVWKPRQVSNDGTTIFPGDQPACVTFHQDRLVFAGALGAPEEIDGSVTGLYETFSPTDPTNLATIAANNAIQFSLLSRDVNAIRWISSASQGLLAGTYESEWTITPSTGAESLSPTNINAQQTSYFGSASVESVRAGNATIYVQRASRKIREMNYFFQVGTFRSTDLSELSEHLTLPAVKKLVVQKETQPIVWGTRTDGQLISMVYNRDDLTLKAGWARHQLGGGSDAAKSAPIVFSSAVIIDPTISFDQLWLVVQRYINGQTVYAIEYMTKIFDDSILQEDAFQLDCGTTFDNPLSITGGITSASPAVVTIASHGLANGSYVQLVGVLGLNKTTVDQDGNSTTSSLVNENTFVVAGVTTNTFQLNDFAGNPIDSTSYSAYVSGGQVRKLISSITGLTYLENETVSILADGRLHPDVVVSNSGGIALQYPAAKVQIGYSFNSDGKLLRPEAGSAEGTSIGQTRRANRLALVLHRIGDLLLGMDFKRLLPVRFEHADVNYADTMVPLFSGLVREEVESGYDYNSQACFRQSTPLPGTINSVTTFLEETDV